MSAPKFTSGPWKVGYGDDHGNYIEARAGYVAIAHYWSRPDHEQKANARLIATAPKLYALVRQLARECAECGGTGRRKTHPAGAVGDCFACADIRSVLAEADGEST